MHTNLKVFVIINFLFFSHNAFAYMDPGSLSIILQVIIGIFASIAVFFKQLKQKVLSVFKRKDKKKDKKKDKE